MVTPIGRKSLLISSKSNQSPVKAKPVIVPTGNSQAQERIYQEDEEIAAELPRPHSFRLVTVDGAQMDLCANDRDDMVSWMKVLTVLLGEIRNHELYAHLILSD